MYLPLATVSNIRSPASLINELTPSSQRLDHSKSRQFIVHGLQDTTPWIIFFSYLLNNESSTNLFSESKTSKLDLNSEGQSKRLSIKVLLYDLPKASQDGFPSNKVPMSSPPSRRKVLVRIS